MGIFEKFKLGFKKSASTFASGLKDIIVKKEIDDETLNKIEDYLIQSDVGTGAASEIKDVIAQEKIDPKKNIVDEVNTILKIIAAPMPQNIIFFLSLCSNWEATIPIMIALSPAKTRSIKTI